MKNHLILWGVALAVAAVAVTLWFARRAEQRPEEIPLTPQEMVQRAVLELETDPAAADVWTQSVVRAAAVEVEAGHVVSPEGDLILAIQYQRERNLAAAEALFKRAILRAPDWSKAYAGLANLLGRHAYGRLDDAEKEIRKAIELDPDWGRAYDILAVILRLKGRMNDAEAAAKKAIALAPNNVAHYNNYANLLMQLGRNSDAEAQYRLAIKVDPENAKPYYNLACLFAKRGLGTKAVDLLKQAIQRAPNLREEASNDPELDPLRGRTDFEKIITASNDLAPDANPKAKAKTTATTKKKAT